MANYIYLTQRTNRHIAKSLSSDVAPATYTGNAFGTFGVPGGTSIALHNPWGITADSGTNNIYVCDSMNKRIVRLNSSLEIVDQYSTIDTIDTPYAIMFDSVTGDLYVVGVWNNRWVRIERLTTTLASIKVSGNLQPDSELLWRPTGISRGFAADSFLVVGANLDIYQTIESGTFSAFTTQAITGETSTYPQSYATNKYTSIVKHSNGDLYLNNSKMIIRANSSFVNIGDSNILGKTIVGLKEVVGGTFLVYNVEEQTVRRYDENLNFLEDVYIDTGDTVSDDAYDVTDFVEVSI